MSASSGQPTKAQDLRWSCGPSRYGMYVSFQLSHHCHATKGAAQPNEFTLVGNRTNPVLEREGWGVTQSNRFLVCRFHCRRIHNSQCLHLTEKARVPQGKYSRWLTLLFARVKTATTTSCCQHAADHWSVGRREVDPQTPWFPEIQGHTLIYLVKKRWRRIGNRNSICSVFVYVLRHGTSTISLRALSTS